MHQGKYENSKNTKIMESFDLDTPSSGEHFEHVFSCVVFNKSTC